MTSIADQLRPFLSGAQPNPRRLKRLLVVILFIIRELSTKKLANARHILQAAAPALLEGVFALYREASEKWLTHLQFSGEDERGAFESMEQSLLPLRIIRRLLVFGFLHPHRDFPVISVWNYIHPQLADMTKLISSASDLKVELEAGPKAILERHLLQIAKIHLKLAEDHRTSFALLPRSVELVHFYWDFVTNFSKNYGRRSNPPISLLFKNDRADDDVPPFSERFSLKGVLILRACVRMGFEPAKFFRTPTEEDRKDNKNAKDLIQNSLLTVSFTETVMHILISRLFTLTPRDLRQWVDDPEEWEIEQAGEGGDWEYNFRTCCEKLFLDLLIQHKDYLVPRFTDLLQSTSQQAATDVFYRDSIYAAIGIAAPILHDKMDFGTFLEQSLVPDIQAKGEHANLIRRRIAIMLGQWLPCKDGLNRPMVYQMFQHLLDRGDPLNDKIVRVTAGRYFPNVIDPFEFSAEGFIPFADGILHRLLSMIMEVELPDIKVVLLNTVHDIILKMEAFINPFGPRILDLLPPLWDAADDEYLIKENIFAILTALVTSMGQLSQRYHQMMAPLIQSAVEPNSQIQLYLGDEAMELWSAILDQTTLPPPEHINGLFKNLIPMLHKASSTLLKALTILETYLYLIPSDIIANVHLIMAPFAGILAGHELELSNQMAGIIQILLRLADNMGGVSLVQQLTSSLISTNVLRTLLEALYDAYQCHQTTGPNQHRPVLKCTNETDYFCILARIAVINPGLFIAAFQAAAPPFPEPDMGWLLNEWFSHFDNTSNPVQRKLFCLALTSLLDTHQPWVLSKMQLLMTVWTSVITEMEEGSGEDVEGQGGPAKRDVLVYGEGNMPPQANDGTIAPLARELMLVDPVHRLNMRHFVREKLGSAVERGGGMEAFTGAWVEDVDGDVLQAFGELKVY